MTLRSSDNILLDIVNRDNVLIVPDARANLLSVICLQAAGHEIVLGKSAGLLIDSNPRQFVPFQRCTRTNLWILQAYPYQPSKSNKDNKAYAFHGDDATAEMLDQHRQLGHPSFKRMRQLSFDQDSRPTKRIARGSLPSCPTCITAKMRHRPTPSAATPEARAPSPWHTVIIDLSGKIKTRAYTGVHYYIIFVCDFSGAKYVDFVTHKSDFIHAYKRFTTHLTTHPKQIKTDRGGEFTSEAFAALLNQNNTNHIFCCPEEHFSIGAAEHAIGEIRTKAKCLMLDSNTPKKFWPFAIGHSVYLANLTSRSRADPSLTVYELLFQRKPDVSKIPPFGCYAASLKPRRTLKDQAFDLTSKPGIFLGVNRYNKTLGYCLTDGTSIWVTRHHVAFDRRFFPLRLQPNATSPSWQTYHHLSTACLQPDLSPLDSASDPLEFEEAPEPSTSTSTTREATSTSTESSSSATKNSTSST